MIIMVTGGNGYIGSHCVLGLLDAGYDVVSFDDFITGHGETSDVFSNIDTKGEFLECFQGDLLALDDLDRVFEKYDIKAVIHFAALSQVGESMTDPKRYYRNNVVGTMNLLDSMVSHDIRYIVFSSTAAVYGEPSYVPIDEKHPKEPINPYGRTKLDIEYMMDDYDKAYGLKSARLRYFNVAGADSKNRVGEWHDPETHLIPNILKSTFEGGREFSIFGDDYPTKDGTCVRDYINVEDLIDAHILALDYLLNGGRTDSFNLGTNQGNTVKEVFDECRNMTGQDIQCRIKGRRAGDPAVLIADNTKAKDVLGWSPKRSLSDSVRTAYAWEKKRQGF